MIIILITIITLLCVANLLCLFAVSTFLTKVGEVIRDLQRQIDEVHLYVVPSEDEEGSQEGAGLVDLAESPTYDDPRHKPMTPQEMEWLRKG
jgi:hypothetical protein